MVVVVRLVAILTAVVVCCVGLCVPAQAAPSVSSAPPTGAPVVWAGVMQGGGSTVVGPVPRVELDWHWTRVTVWYSKAETKRIVATNGACSVIVGKVPGWIAKALSGSCGLIAVWAGYALARDRCVGLDVSYFAAYPHNFKTRRC